MYCEKPNIIINPTLYKYVQFGNGMIYTNGVYTYQIHDSIPSPKLVGATNENYKNWSLLTQDGELIPIYSQVACGKCMLCREKKAKEWSTRATCETAAATYPPLFVTLTYASGYRPFDGVQKEDVQKFLKRFRENWFRKNGERLNLRYFACAEYGHHGGLPHYHLLLWNIPHRGKDDYVGLQKIYDVVCRSWSEECSKKWYFNLPSKRYKFLQYTENGKYYTLFGKIDLSPDNGKSAPYCMKYMRKPKDVPQQWSQPTFYLSSRRHGGIGIPYLNKQLESYRRQPSKTTIDVPVDYNTRIATYSLPRIFKDKIFPSMSCLLPIHIRCSIERFETLYQALKFTNEDVYDMLYEMRESLKKHYGVCYSNINKSSQFYKKEKLVKIPDKYLNYYDKKNLFTQLVILFTQLFDFQPNTNTLERLNMLKERRIELLSRMKIPDIDIEYEKSVIANRIVKGKIREKF